VGTPKSGLPNGQVRHLLLDPSSPAKQRRLFATSNGNGIFESRDGGLSWSSIIGDLPSQPSKQPRGILLDNGNPKHLVVALGETPESGGGIYSTLDGGRSWQRTNKAPPFADITALIAGPGDLSTLYVATRQHYDHSSGKNFAGGLFVSQDGGSAWRQVLDFRFVQTVAISPIDPRVIYAGTTDNPYHDDYPAEGVLKSNDGGNTWRRVNAGLSHRGIQSLSINPHDPSLLYAGTSGNGAFVGKDADVGRRPIKVLRPFE
jgi:photosystem II stability/assembly factor-like uncharacterized protein